MVYVEGTHFAVGIQQTLHCNNVLLYICLHNIYIYLLNVFFYVSYVICLFIGMCQEDCPDSPISKSLDIH